MHFLPNQINPDYLVRMIPTVGPTSSKPNSHVKPLLLLTNIRLKFLPKNTTRVLQPLDQGIIASTKRRFSRFNMEDRINRYIAGLPQQKISVFTALSWAARAEAQSAAQASATNTASLATRPTTTKPVKMSVPTFDGKDSDSLVFWVREIEIALSAGQIYDAGA
ncbi:unnamed protein product [Phytophthora fragariaefolia]|uniref:Unnamed protein product n=1 Tax=Phytophthora fragariaefolia TaxID=1490495 RepID=A0A9W6TUG7_9STRA|nr:unnamed protein product [Phytophthora fragariaefolia]